jgi:hypothetical protein
MKQARAAILQSDETDVAVYLAPELADGVEPIFHMQPRFLRRHKPLIPK